MEHFLEYPCFLVLNGRWEKKLIRSKNSEQGSIFFVFRNFQKFENCSANDKIFCEIYILDFKYNGKIENVKSF